MSEGLETPRELQERIAVEREGRAFLVLRDGDDRQRLVALAGDRVVVGRDAASDVALPWDPKVSSLHARLEREGRYWTLHDDGLSRNGSYVEGERVQGQKVLRDGDELRFGDTLVTFRDPSPRPSARTVTADKSDLLPTLSPAQKRVLVALCRPYRDRPTFARPASNHEIAGELVVTVEAVKSQLRALFAKFDLDRLPPNEKRVRLVELALRSGLVRQSELR